MIGYQQEQRSLTKEQKQAIGLLSVGTFLEYFDLMLYVHMAVFLNELFFPKAAPHTTTIYSATAFCSIVNSGEVGDVVTSRRLPTITKVILYFTLFGCKK